MEYEFREAVMLTAVKRLKKAYKPAFGYILWRQQMLEFLIGEGYLASTEVRTRGRPSYLLTVTKDGERRLRYLMHYLDDEVVNKEVDRTLGIYNRLYSKMETSRKRTEEKARQKKKTELKERKRLDDTAEAVIEALKDDRIRQMVMDKLRER